jgi:hypothetical protein
VTVEPWTDDDLPRAMDAYRREPVRFRRAPEDYRRALDCGVVMNRPTEFLAVRENGAFRGYLLVGRRGGEGVPLRVAEFTGDRRALLAALPEALRRHPDAPEIGWQVPGHDVLFRDLCAAAAGLTGTPASMPGTVKLVNFPQLLERMRPLWEELLGVRRAAFLEFWQRGDDEYGIRLGAGELVLNRDDATRLLFGAPDGVERRLLDGRRGGGELADALATILPLPCPWYGLNYV